jgi:hypothetical protein
MIAGDSVKTKVHSSHERFSQYRHLRYTSGKDAVSSLLLFARVTGSMTRFFEGLIVGAHLAWPGVVFGEGKLNEE